MPTPFLLITSRWFEKVQFGCEGANKVHHIEACFKSVFISPANIHMSNIGLVPDRIGGYFFLIFFFLIFFLLSSG